MPFELVFITAGVRTPVSKKNYTFEREGYNMREL